MSNFPGMLAVVATAACTGVLRADTIAVPNRSFESPATPFVSINIDSWQKAPKPDWYLESGGYLWTQLTGIFRNTATNTSGHIDNCDGNQALWLFAVPEVGLFQDYDSIDWRNQTQEFNALFNVGKSYRLTVGVIGGGGGMLEGATLDARLYYRDPSSNQVPVGVLTLTNSPAVFSNLNHLVDCTLVVPRVKATDPWAGHHIGIQFASTVTTNLQGGYWDLDNVRLSEIGEPLIANPFSTNGQFGFSLLSEPGAVFEILSSSNLSLPLSNWTSVGLLTNESGSNIFTQPASDGQRVYGARQLP